MIGGVGPMGKLIAELLRFLFSGSPLFLIAAADVYFFGAISPHQHLSDAAYVIQVAVLTIAALVAVPSKVVRLTCTILLLIVAVLGSMTIGVFYFPAVLAAALLTAYQSKVDRRNLRIEH